MFIGQLKICRRIVEDVKNDKFVFLINFVVINMNGGNSIPLNIDRPFLVTYNALIDVSSDEIKVKLITILGIPCI